MKNIRKPGILFLNCYPNNGSNLNIGKRLVLTAKVLLCFSSYSLLLNFSSKKLMLQEFVRRASLREHIKTIFYF